MSFIEIIDKGFEMNNSTWDEERLIEGFQTLFEKKGLTKETSLAVLILAQILGTLILQIVSGVHHYVFTFLARPTILGKGAQVIQNHGCLILDMQSSYI